MKLRSWEPLRQRAYAYGRGVFPAAAAALLLVACDRGGTNLPPTAAVTTPVAATAAAAVPFSLRQQVYAALDAHALAYMRAVTPVVLPTPGAAAAWKQALMHLQAAGITVVAQGDVVVLHHAAQRLEVLPPPRAWLALIVDDVGFRRDRIRTMLAWPVPVVFAILPERPLSSSLANEIRAAGRDVFLHQPMEPQDYPTQDPGPLALLLRDSPATWTALLDQAAAGLWPVAGVNNHMGSRFTAHAAGAQVVAAWLKANDLMFVDSLTTPHTAMRAACVAAGVPYVSRDVFLDHARSATELTQQIDTWLLKADRRGLAVAIGHPHHITLQHVGARIQQTLDDGYRWVGARELRAWAQWQQRGAS